MPITFKVERRFTADDNRTKLEASNAGVEYRTRVQVAIAPDGRYNGQPRRFQVIVPFKQTAPNPKGPPPGPKDDTSPDAVAWWERRARAEASYQKASDEAWLAARCIADFLDHIVAGEATPPDPRLQAMLKGIYAQ